MKRSIVIVLAVFLLAALSISAFAATVTIATVEVAKETEFKVPVTIKGITSDCGGYSLYINYDDTKLNFDLEKTKENRNKGIGGVLAITNPSAGYLTFVAHSFDKKVKGELVPFDMYFTGKAGIDNVVTNITFKTDNPEKPNKIDANTIDENGLINGKATIGKPPVDGIASVTTGTSEYDYKGGEATATVSGAKLVNGSIGVAVFEGELAVSEIASKTPIDKGWIDAPVAVDGTTASVKIGIPKNNTAVAAKYTVAAGMMEGTAYSAKAVYTFTVKGFDSEIKSMIVSPSDLTLEITDSVPQPKYKLKALVTRSTPAEGDKQFDETDSVTWKASSSGITVVKGEVTALIAGSYTVEIEAGGKAAKGNVIVTDSRTPRKSDLEKLIASSEALLANAKIGFNKGEYTQAAYDALKKAIDSAKAVVNGNYAEVERAIQMLNFANITFVASASVKDQNVPNDAKKNGSYYTSAYTDAIILGGPTNPEAEITIRILDANGEIMKNIRIRVNGKEYKVNENGEAIVKVSENITTKVYIISAEYGEQSVRFNAAAKATVTVVADGSEKVGKVEYKK